MKLTSDEWLPMLKETFGSCGSVSELLEESKWIWKLRHLQGVKVSAVSAWRQKLLSLWPQRDSFSVTVVDYSAIAWVAYSVGAGEEGCIDLIRDIYRTHRPKCFILAWDGDKNPKKLNPEYKGQRKPKDPEFIEQLNNVREALNNRGVIFFGREDREADDAMATISFHCQLLGVECTLVTEDKDMWQTLGCKTSIYSRRKKEFRDINWLQEKHSIGPWQVVDYLSLVGKNDIKGCDGIGPKMASKLLSEHKTVHGIIENIDQLTPKKKESLLDFYENRYREVKRIHQLDKSIGAGWISEFGKTRSKKTAA